MFAAKPAIKWLRKGGEADSTKLLHPWVDLGGPSRVIAEVADEVRVFIPEQPLQLHGNVALRSKIPLPVVLLRSMEWNVPPPA